jgi:MFS family permease
VAATEVQTPSFHGQLGNQIIGFIAPSLKSEWGLSPQQLGPLLSAGLGGVLAAHMIPAYGWRSVLLFGGYVPIAFAVALLLLLPESVRFLVPQVANAMRMGCDLTRFERVRAIHAHCMRLQAFIDAAPGKQPDYIP